MSRSKWRAHSARVINQVLTQQPGLSVAEARKAIAAAYPFGERKMWPYHCWLLEVRLALAALAKLSGEPLPARFGKLPRQRQSANPAVDIPGQLPLGGGTGR